jgi:hypothetical protein
MRNRIDKIDKIIKAENLLREGVDPRKIFSELHGVPNKDSDNLDYFTVYLPGVGYNWIVGKEFLSRDIWYTYSSVFKNDRCAVGMYGDRNWIKKDGSILKPDNWLDSVGDFNDNGIALGRLDRKTTWFGKDGQRLSKFSYDCVNKKDGILNLFVIKDRNKGYNVARCDGIPILSNWYFLPPRVFSDEKSIIITKEVSSPTEDSKIKFQIIDLEEKELTPWYDWISGVSDGYAIVIDNSRNKRYNFINSSGELITTEWYTTATDFVSGKGRVSDGKDTYSIDVNGKLIKEL